VVAELERRDLTPHVVAEIDSLTLLMNCVYDGMGVTIKPMSALQHEGERGRNWRALRISDANLARRNYIYSIGKSLMSPAASAVAIELRDTAQMLVTSGTWQGVSLVEPKQESQSMLQVAAE
jgi:LysR family tcuABC transcriptional regulator